MWTVTYDRNTKILSENNVIMKFHNDDITSIIENIGIFINPGSYQDANPFQDEQVFDEDEYLQVTTLMLVIKVRNIENVKLIENIIPNDKIAIYSDKRPNHIYCILIIENYKLIKTIFEIMEQKEWINGNIFKEGYDYLNNRCKNLSI